jgi:hypothetical protein
MKKSKSAGLIAAGNLTDSALTRYWSLADRLGPVKSPTYRLASRIANILRAGHPVRDYGELNSCRLILICVPDRMLSRTISELAQSGIAWQGKAVVLCNTSHDSSDLPELGARGAAIGSITPVPGFDDKLYLVEGDKLAVREAGALVEHRDRRAIAIERPLKPLYLAALTCTGTLLFALLFAASESLRHARLPASLSATILDRQLARTLRALLKGGRRAFPPAEGLPRQLRALSHADPALAAFVDQNCRLAEQLLGDAKARTASTS